jgi:EAL domain-containing protein (putative c-di-GMP-specific phosphodiesterase class I)
MVEQLVTVADKLNISAVLVEIEDESEFMISTS